jgi:hypothetical protein
LATVLIRRRIFPIWLLPRETASRVERRRWPDRPEPGIVDAA